MYLSNPSGSMGEAHPRRELVFETTSEPASVRSAAEAVAGVGSAHELSADLIGAGYSPVTGA